MKNKQSNIKLGLKVAPLAGPLTLFVIVLISTNVGNNVFPMSVIDFISSITLFIIIGAPFSYFVAISLGMPAYLVVRKLGFVNFWSISLGSATIALIPTFVLTTWFGFNQATNGSDPLHLYYAMFVSGYIVGIVFWFTSGAGKESDA